MAPYSHGLMCNYKSTFRDQNEIRQEYRHKHLHHGDFVLGKGKGVGMGDSRVRRWPATRPAVGHGSGQELQRGRRAVGHGGGQELQGHALGTVVLGRGGGSGMHVCSSCRWPLKLLRQQVWIVCKSSLFFSFSIVENWMILDPFLSFVWINCLYDGFLLRCVDAILVWMYSCVCMDAFVFVALYGSTSVCLYQMDLVWAYAELPAVGRHGSSGRSRWASWCFRFVCFIKWALITVGWVSDYESLRRLPTTSLKSGNDSWFETGIECSLWHNDDEDVGSVADARDTMVGSVFGACMQHSPSVQKERCYGDSCMLNFLNFD